MQIKNLKATIEYLTHHMLNANESAAPSTAVATSTSARPSRQQSSSEEVNPIVVRKHPKFGTRDRHLAIRRKRAIAPGSPTDSQRSEILTIPGSPSIKSEDSGELESLPIVESSTNFCCEKK